MERNMQKNTFDGHWWWKWQMFRKHTGKTQHSNNRNSWMTANARVNAWGAASCFESPNRKLSPLDTVSLTGAVFGQSGSSLTPVPAATCRQQVRTLPTSLTTTTKKTPQTTSNIKEKHVYPSKEGWSARRRLCLCDPGRTYGQKDWNRKPS